MTRDEGFAEVNDNLETPTNDNTTEKPLSLNKKKSNKVDINILKSKMQKAEKLELKKNIFILALLIIVLAFFGIYLTI